MNTNFVKNATLFFVLAVNIFIFSNSIGFAFPWNVSSSKEATSPDNSNYELGKRYLKLGNTYREAKNYSMAFRYLNQGMKTFEGKHNIEEQYWFATANEYLAYYYRDINELQQAQKYLAIAKNIYDRIITQPDGSNFAISNVILEKINTINTDKQIIIKKEVCIKNNDDEFELDDYRYCYNSKYKFNYDNRSLTSFPSDFSGNRIDNLSMCNNHIEQFPERILSFRTLEVLIMSTNPIKIFPSLNKLKMLKYLDFSGNQFTEVGSTIGDLHNLEYLNLSNNRQLKTISNEIYKLKKLRVLDVRNTSLSRHTIDDLISRLHSTNVLYSLLPISPTLAAEESDIDFNDDEWDDDDDGEWDDWDN